MRYLLLYRTRTGGGLSRVDRQVIDYKIVKLEIKCRNYFAWFTSEKFVKFDLPPGQVTYQCGVKEWHAVYGTFLRDFAEDALDTWLWCDSPRQK